MNTERIAYPGGCTAVFAFPVLLILKLTNIIDWSWLGILAFSIYALIALYWFRTRVNEYHLKKKNEELIRNAIEVKNIQKYS